MIQCVKCVEFIGIKVISKPQPCAVNCLYDVLSVAMPTYPCGWTFWASQWNIRAVSDANNNSELTDNIPGYLKTPSPKLQNYLIQQYADGNRTIHHTNKHLVLFICSSSRLCRVPKRELLRLLQLAGCPSCHPTISDKTLNE